MDKIWMIIVDRFAIGTKHCHPSQRGSNNEDPRLLLSFLLAVSILFGHLATHATNDGKDMGGSS